MTRDYKGLALLIAVASLGVGYVLGVGIGVSGLVWWGKPLGEVGDEVLSNTVVALSAVIGYLVGKATS